MKTCTKCKQDRPFAEFGKTKLGKNGLRSICKPCHNAINTKWAKDNSEHVTAYGKNRREEKKDQISAQRAIHTAQNKERLAAYQRAWTEANPGKANARTARRRATRRQAMPKWLTKDHHLEILARYDEAARKTKETGIPHEVDHIVPLQGKTARGLHVPWNLRVITSQENRRKSRKILP